MTPPDPSLSAFGTGDGPCFRCSVESSRRRADGCRAGSGGEVSVKARLGWRLLAASRILPVRQFETTGGGEGDVTGAWGAPPPGRLKQGASVDLEGQLLEGQLLEGLSTRIHQR
jgi:hypothetical protein